MRKRKAFRKKIIFIAAGLLLTVNIHAQEYKTRVLTIDEMFRLASENSKQLKWSYSQVESAKRVTETEKDKRLPSLGSSLSLAYLGNGILMNRDFSHATIAPNPHLDNSFALEASQIIFAGGCISNRIIQAELEEKIAALGFDKEKLNIRLLLLGYYLDLYKQMNQQMVYLKYIEQVKALISQIKARKQVGMSMNNDVTRYELLLKMKELALTETENNSRILNNQLVTVLGLSDSVRIVPDSSSIHMVPANETLEELLTESNRNLPDIREADLKLQVAGKKIQITRAESLPSVSVVTGDYLNGPITFEIPPINKNYNYWYIGLGVNYNLSSLYTMKKKINLAKSEENTAAIGKKVVEEQSGLAIKNACIKYNESFDVLQTSEKSLLLARENYHVIYDRYLNNLVLITEMLDADNEKLNAELQVVNARIDILFNYYNLKRLTGTL